MNLGQNRPACVRNKSRPSDRHWPADAQKRAALRGAGEPVLTNDDAMQAANAVSFANSMGRPVENWGTAAVFIINTSPDRRQRLFQIPQQILHRF